MKWLRCERVWLHCSEIAPSTTKELSTSNGEMNVNVSFTFGQSSCRFEKNSGSNQSLEPMFSQDQNP